MISPRTLVCLLPLPGYISLLITTRTCHISTTSSPSPTTSPSSLSPKSSSSTSIPISISILFSLDGFPGRTFQSRLFSLESSESCLQSSHLSWVTRKHYSPSFECFIRHSCLLSNDCSFLTSSGCCISSENVW